MAGTARGSCIGIQSSFPEKEGQKWKNQNMEKLVAGVFVPEMGTLKVAIRTVNFFAFIRFQISCTFSHSQECAA